jgi:hypothetical protein
MFPEAISELQKAVQLSGGSPTCVANLARAFAESGKRTEATTLLSQLKARSSRGYRQQLKTGLHLYYGILNGFWFCAEALANGAA